MNEIVRNNIDQYVTEVSPRYAILITGTWGCGKTYFIDKWIKEYNTQHAPKESAEDEEQELKYLAPVKVSLFGTSTINDVNSRIRSALNPAIEGIKKVGGKLLRITSSVLTGNDALGEIDIPLDFDVKMWELVHKKSIGAKILILDDLERCRVPVVELFGIIDMFLNLYDFHVIVIGDEGHLSDEGKGTYKQYKEKIIGNVFYLTPDVTPALTSFIKESQAISLSACDFYNHHQTMIVDIFAASTYQNLRTLRQALHQFAFLYDKLENGADDYKKSMLANYIAYSMEVHNNAGIDWITVINQLRGSLYNRDNTIVSILSKYQFVGIKHKITLFKNAEFLYNAIAYGWDVSPHINYEIRRIKSTPLSLIYKDYATMSNKDFARNTKLLREYLSSDITDENEYMVLLYFYCKVQNEGLAPHNKNLLRKCKNKCIARLNSIKTLNDFVPVENKMRYAVSSTAHLGTIEEFEKIVNEICDVISRQKIRLKDDLSIIMESLTDDRIEEFETIISGSDPYNHANYELQSIFDKIDVNDFVKGYLALSNFNKSQVYIYIQYRYARLQNSIDLRKNLQADIENMTKIADLLEVKCRSLTVIEKHQVEMFCKMLREGVKQLQQPDVKI